jgi:hypothetical protein
VETFSSVALLLSIIFTIFGQRVLSKGMKQKCKIEIISLILEAANGGGATKTTI